MLGYYGLIHLENHIQNEKDHVHDYFTNYELKHVVDHHEVKPDIFFEELREMVIKSDPVFLKSFREVYPEFTANILKKHPYLIKSEFSLCAMIFLDFSAKEIAEYTFIQHRSVQTNRSRLRRKMKLSSEVNLDQYIRSFA